MSGNPLLKIFIPLVVLAVFAVIFMSARNDHKTAQTGREDLTLSADEARELGMEGDTSADTLRTLIGEIKRTRGEVEAMREQNRKLFEENQRLLARDQNIDARIAGEVDKARQQFSAQNQQVQTRAQNLLEQLQDKMDTLSGLGGGLGSLDVPVGFGLSAGDGETVAGTPPVQSLIWVQPLDATPADPRSGAGGGFVFPDDFQAADNKAVQTVSERLGEPAKPKRTEQTRAVYTIPENATLTGSITMTALLGRVPIDGTVNDPYPFKVLIGKDNLTANGIELPDVQGAVMSGTATGDWTLSCVRGQIESITFVFDDGTLRTLPLPEETVTRGASRTSSADGRIRGGIGYLSDPFGVPCIVGTKKSNAAEYLGNQSLLTAAGAAVASVFSKDDKGNAASGSGNTVISDRNQAFNTILSQGVGDIRQWMGKLYGQAFAAVYVPPQQPVAVHIEQELTIDYEPHGRQVVSDNPIDPVYSTQAALD